MVFIINNDTSEQSIRQMNTIVNYLECDQIFLDYKWMSFFPYNPNVEYISLNKYLRKSNSCKYIIFTNIIDGIRLIKYKKIYNLRLVFRPRGILPEESLFKNNSILKKKVLDLIEFTVCKLTEVFIFLNEQQKKHYIKKYHLKPKNVYILPNVKPLDDNLNHNIKSGCIEVVYSGGFSKWQNVEKIFDIFKDLASSDLSIRFTILTFESNFTKALELGKLYELTDKLTVKYVTERELDKELTNYDIGVIIRDDNIINLTASPFKIIDYVSSGLALIVTESIFDQARYWIDEQYIFSVTMNEKGLEYQSTMLKEFVQKIKDSKPSEVIINQYRNILLNINKIQIRI